MTPTRALMAVRVWLRASERISVRVLDISDRSRFLGRIFARHPIVHVSREAKRYRREIGQATEVAARRRHEAHDFRAHNIPSSRTIATRSMIALEIKYAVIHRVSFKKKMRGMTALCRRSFRARTLSPEARGPPARATRAPTSAFARTGQYG